MQYTIILSFSDALETTTDLKYELSFARLLMIIYYPIYRRKAWLYV